jgi:long-chain-fatty-acid--CoA ligase ACSBG
MKNNQKTISGVMLSHDNIIWNVSSGVIDNLIIVNVGKERIVSYLPLSHAAGQMIDIFGNILIAATIYFADKNAMKGTLFETVKEVEPTVFFTVPRLFEKIHEKMLAIGAQSGFLKRTIAGWAKRVTLQHHLDRLNGNPTDSIQYKIASSLILSKVKQAIGFQQCKTFMTGAAPLSVEIKRYFLSLDMFIHEGYGMSESPIHTFTKRETKSHETVGQSLPGTQTKIINVNEDGHGEICMKGRHVFMGYINDPEKTLEAIDDERWLHSGDLGYIDDEGYIYVTGRIKEILITSGGENIPYLVIEQQIKQECSAISNAFLIGDKKKFLALFITLKTVIGVDGAPCDELDEETIKWLKNHNLTFTKLSEIRANDSTVKEAIQECIKRVNAKATSNAQKIQKFEILPNDFTIATGELTPTMKLKRNFVLKKYKDIIDGFYA